MFLADDNTLAFAPLFNPRPGFARCVSKCPGIDRSDVTWCVRLAYVDDTIEFCVSLGDRDQLVFNSTCNTEALGIQVEEHLSLPNVRFYSPRMNAYIIHISHRGLAAYLEAVLVALDSITSTGFSGMPILHAYLRQKTVGM